MLSVLYIVFATLFLIGALVTLYALHHAVPGYEDQTGFHPGRPPKGVGRGSFIKGVRVLHNRDAVPGNNGKGSNPKSAVVGRD